MPKPEPVAAAAASPPATAAAPPSPPPPPPTLAAPAPQKRADGRVIATPYAKKLAKELGVDLAQLAGNGPAGRITASDVESFKKGGNGGNSLSVTASLKADSAAHRDPDKQSFFGFLQLSCTLQPSRLRQRQQPQRPRLRHRHPHLPQLQPRPGAPQSPTSRERLCPSQQCR